MELTYKMPSPKKRKLKSFFYPKTEAREEMENYAEKTLDIRRYNNDSVLMGKVRNLVKRSRMETEQRKLRKILSHERWEKKRRSGNEGER